MKEKLPNQKKSKAKEQIDKLTTKAKDMKDKYDDMDDDTKKKVMAGVGGALALLAAIGAAKKIKKHRNDKR